MNERIVSELSPAGRGAICVLGLFAGDVANRISHWFQPVGEKSLTDHPHLKPVYGYWVGSRDDPLREDIIVRRRSDDELEIHCHGGRFARQRILSVLERDGFRFVPWRELDRFPVIGATRGETSIAARRLLPLATTEKTAAVLNWQARGALDRAFLHIDALIAANQRAAALASIESLLQWSTLGRHLVAPWRVAVSGPPNVGKSSLINRILGFERSIVFPQPGTTRDLVTTLTAMEGWPVELTDTAGLRECPDALESAGVALAQQAAADADLFLYVVDLSLSTDGSGSGTFPAGRAMRVGNKSDLIADLDCSDSSRRTEINVSALTGDGIPELLIAIRKRLVPLEPEPDQAVPFLPEHLERLERRVNGM